MLGLQAQLTLHDSTSGRHQLLQLEDGNSYVMSQVNQEDDKGLYKAPDPDLIVKF